LLRPCAGPVGTRAELLFLREVHMAADQPLTVK